MKFGVSQPVRRKEDQRFLTGTGRYVDDINMPGQAYAHVVRSPHAFAEIVSIDAADALAAPGVLAVYTGADLEADGMGHLPCNIALENRDGTPRADTPRPALAVGKVRFVGDPVAVVVAESTTQARDAAEMVFVDYEDLQAAVDLGAAAEAGAPQVWDHVPGNVAFDWEQYDKETTDAAFAAAAHVVTMDLVNNRVIPNPIEPRSALASYDGDDGRWTIHLQTQGTHSLRRQIAEAFLKVPQENVHVITPDVGGGFGMKLFFFPEYAMAAYATRKLGRPVKWTGDRAESFLADTHGRGHLTHAELAMDGEGKILGLRLKTLADLGAYLSGAGPLIPTMAYVPIITGQYVIPTVHAEVQGIFTNTAPVDAYRGAGRPEAMYVIERLVDNAAAQLGQSPEDMRRRNLVKPEAMPYTTATGLVFDSGDFPRIMDRAKDLADWNGFETRRQAAEASGKMAGIGLSCYVEVTGGAPTEDAEILFNEDDTVSVLVGTLSTGQGHETAFAQLVAERLGLDFEQVDIIQGDSDRIRSGGGTGGSRSLYSEGGAIVVTTDKIVEKGRGIAANVLEAAVADIEFREGRFTVAGTDLGIGILDLARAARDPANLAEGMEPGLDATGTYEVSARTFPNGCHVCEVEVDPDTGETQVTKYTVVDDMGNVVNPLLVAGQVHGGIAQGLGQALMEQTVYDETGQLLSGSFMDYRMPRADDLPAITFEMEPTLCTTNPLGTKGCGEAGAIGAPTAVISAIENALAPLGVKVGDVAMPATPLSIWQIIQQARAG